MLKRILSGGRSGADRAALDFAIKNDIPHGGDVPRGKAAGVGPAPSVHRPEEIHTSSFGAQEEQDIAESDGTLVVTRGTVAAGAALALDLAAKHGRPRLHIDLEDTNVFGAAEKVNRWLSENGIETLTVKGDPEGDPPDLYQGCFNLLQVVYHLNLIESNMPDPSRAAPHLPKTVDEAVRRLESRLTLRDKVTLARMGDTELPMVFPMLGEYIMTRFGLGLENRDLMQSCRLVSGEDLTKEEASTYILKELWKRLKNRYGLRIVK